MDMDLGWAGTWTGTKVSRTKAGGQGPRTRRLWSRGGYGPRRRSRTQGGTKAKGRSREPMDQGGQGQGSLWSSTKDPRLWSKEAMVKYQGRLWSKETKVNGRRLWSSIKDQGRLWSKEAKEAMVKYQGRLWSREAKETKVKYQGPKTKVKGGYVWTKGPRRLRSRTKAD